MLIKKANEKRLTLSFYKYHNIKNVEVFRNYLFTNFNNLNILGRIYVASEGAFGRKMMEDMEFRNFAFHARIERLLFNATPSFLIQGCLQQL